MGIELLEIGLKMRKGVIFTIRWCFRSVCNHPFLVGFLCFLIFLYRSSPFIFSLLVSASPVLVCTAVLLGILLSFGQPNIPEIELEEKTAHEAVSMKTGVSRDAIVIEQNESYNVDRYTENRRDEAEQSTENLAASKIGEVCREGSSDDTAPLIVERSREIELENGEIWEANRELGDLRYKQKTEWNEERLNDGDVLENQYISIPKVNDEHLESDDEKSEADSFDSEMVNVDSLDSPPHSPWKHVQEREEEEEEEDDVLDSGSDGSESSSPDASMADIMPMLDELHPLLDEDAPQPVQMSRDGSDAASERSSQSSTSSHESDDETDNHEDLEVAGDDNEDGEDDEDVQGDKEEQTKSAITWTEEDQKNLMDLGSSEIERNQRLENLILRRRSRKNMSMVPEINLIDLESSDLPFHIAPISTTRQNPFDVPHDSYDNSGLPPIPGSAPSILLTRRNPFDIPYDSSEEKPNLIGDGFQEEFTTLQSREPFFRRHESFNVGPSILAPNRPYFVPERTIPEESSYSQFHRQSSELSDSKVSSVPETESIGSVEHLEDQKLAEEDNLQKLEVISTMEEVIEECPSGEPEEVSKREVIDEDVPLEPQLISEMKHVPENVGHGSQSSEEEESLELDQDEKRDVEFNDLKFESQDVEDHYEEGSVGRPAEVQATGYDSCSEAVEQRYIRGSSSSSMSETEGEGVSMLDGRRDGVSKEPDISTQTSVESTDLRITSTLVEDVTHKEPVYDSSPPAVGKNFSSSSSSSDVHADSDLSLPPVLVKRTVSFIERESEGISQEIEKEISSNIKILPEPSVDVHESGPTDVVNIREHDSINSDFSRADQRSESEGASAAPGVICHISVPSESLIEDSLEENLIDRHTEGQVPSSSSHKNIHALLKSSDDKNLGQSEEEKHLLIPEIESQILVSAPPFEGQIAAEHSIDKEETVLSPNSDVDVYHEANEKLISTPSAEGSTSLFCDITMHDRYFEHLDEVQVPNTPVESFEEVRNIYRLNIPGLRALDHDISPNINSPFGSDFISMPSSASEEASSHVDMQTILEEEDEIKEIDEVLLSELDSVGDFSISQWGSGSNEFEKHMDSVGETSLAHHSENSITRVVEVNTVEEDKINHLMHLENSRDEIDIYKEETSQTSIAEQIDISNREFNERDGQDSPDQITSEEDTISMENEARPADSVVNHNYEDNISGIAQGDVKSIEIVDSIHNKAESASVEAESMVGSAEVSHHSQVDIDTVSGMPELEVRKLEDKEIEKPVVLEPPQAKLVIGQTIVRHSETPILEVRSTEDATLDYKQVNDGSIESHRFPDSVDHVLHVVDSRETQGTSELHVAETISSEVTSLPSEQVLDCYTEKQLKQNSSEGPIEEVKVEKVDSSLDKEESSVKEISSIAAETHEVEAPEDLHATTVKGKGKISKSSSSSSSSSSESSSSDSDKE